MSEYLYGKLNKLVEQVEYKGSTTSTARVNVDNTNHEISVDVLNPVNQDLTGAILYNKKQDLNDAQINQVHSNLKLNDFINSNAIVPNKSNQTISGDLQISGKLTTKSLTVSDNSIVIEKYDEENDAIIYVTSNGILKYNNGKLNQAVVTLSDGIKADKFLKYNGETVVSEDIYPKDINTKDYTPKNTTDITTKDYVDRAVRKDTNYSIVETFNDFNAGASWVGKRVLVKEDIDNVEDIKDRVYINNDYIFDYYLTSEKVNEFKRLKSDFESEVSNRESSDTELNSEINRVQSNLDTVNTNLTKNINDLRDYSNSTFETIANAANIAHFNLENDIATVQDSLTNTETTLTNAINQEITDRKDADTELRELIDQNTAKTEELDNKIDLEVKTLNQTINTTVTGANKWIAPVDTESDLVIPEDRRFNYLCKVIDTGYTYQLLIDSDSWVLYSKTEDYIDPIELSSSIETHNTSVEAHSDIRQEIESLSERVDGLPTDSNIQSLADRITITESDIDALELEAHTHINKDLLDTYTQTEANLADAVTKKHEHLNKTILDNTTASYTEEEKEKLTNLNSNDYEKLSNKVIEITDAVTNDNYPSALAVKNYIDINGGNIDISNLVTLNTAQEITGGKTFTNLYISNENNSIVSIRVDENDNINLNSDTNPNIVLNVDGLNTNNLYYNNNLYYIYDGINSSYPDITLATLSYVQQFSGSSGSSIASIDSVNCIVNLKENLNNIPLNILSEGSVVIVLDDTYSQTIEGNPIVLEHTPIKYTYINNNWDETSKTVQLIPFYSQCYVDTTVSYQFKFYGVSNNTAIQVYPTQVESLTIQKNGSTIGTYTGNATTINVDLSDYALNSSLNNYVTTTSLNNTLNNYVTTTNLNTQLSTKLNINQGSENANKILMVDSNGNISLVDVSVSLTDNTIIFEANLQEN